MGLGMIRGYGITRCDGNFADLGGGVWIHQLEGVQVADEYRDFVDWVGVECGPCDLWGG